MLLDYAHHVASFNLREQKLPARLPRTHLALLIAPTIDEHMQCEYGGNRIAINQVKPADAALVNWREEEQWSQPSPHMGEPTGSRGTQLSTHESCQDTLI